MEGSKKGSSKDDMSGLEKMHADFAAYVRHNYFSGKDIEGDEIFQEIVNIGGMIIKGSRFSPTLSYEDPVAYRNSFTATCVIDENVVAGIGDKANRIPRLEFPVEPAGNQAEPLDESDDSSNPDFDPVPYSDSDSLQEISADVFNEAQSANKQANSGAGPSQKRL